MEGLNINEHKLNCAQPKKQKFEKLNLEEYIKQMYI